VCTWTASRSDGRRIGSVLKLGMMSLPAAILKLGRLKMTVFSAVTYAAGASLALSLSSSGYDQFSPWNFAWGYVFVLLCQLMAHFTGEYYDLRSDRLNVHASPLTGGSRVLLAGDVSPSIALVMGTFCLVGSFGVLWTGWFTCQDSEQAKGLIYLGLAMILVANQYSSPPFALNHRGLGEAGAALVMNVLLPWFAALLQCPSFFPNPTPLAPLIVPPFFLKFALLLALNLEDRRPDWLGSKRTLAVKLGEEASARLFALAVGLGYASVAVLYAARLSRLCTCLSILASAPWGLGIARDFCLHRPYKLDRLVLRCLKHAPMAVLGIFASCLAEEVLALGAASLTSPSLFLRCLPLVPFLLGFLPKRHRTPVEQKGVERGGSRSSSSSSSSSHPGQRAAPQSSVLIVGGGVGGLALAAALARLDIPFELYERRDCSADPGADLALWPSAIKILKLLSPPLHSSSRDGDWVSAMYPVREVFMSNKSADGQEEVLKHLDMTRVCRGSGEQFSLIGRAPLIHLLTSAVPADRRRIATVVGIRETPQCAVLEMQDGSRVTGRLAVGADGIRSKCRVHVAGTKEAGRVRVASEVCYRGLLDFRSGGAEALRQAYEQEEKKRPSSMTISYGDKTRSSWGFLDSGKETGYWFVKQIVSSSDDGPSRPANHTSWPEPLRSFQEHTKSVYVHSIQDRSPLAKWSSPRATLIGDACHAVTPNNGQGACMAIEDALVLAVLLKKYWSEEDGHVEAFYRYQRAREAHTTAIYHESYKQMKLGQLTSPLGCWMRSTILKLLPAHVLEGKLRAGNMFDIEPWAAEFQLLQAEAAAAAAAADGVLSGKKKTS
jgi:2-polyprenyl-6-methoxyphenol hydroxylase-like FAD-dependent oxidoreductase/1,4-dihydroxy-2-naphthoate octaprenyltransferase